MASSSTLQLSSTLTSGTSVTTVSPTDSSTSSNSSTYGNNPYGPSNGQGADGLPGGPNIYLYGFLATLVLIFLVSIAVAWKGYNTRRLLRARIEEAIARGVYIPGYGDPPDLRRQRRPVGPKPDMWEEWIERKNVHTNKPLEENPIWDIKPTSVSISRPATTSIPPPSQRSTSPASVTRVQHYRLGIRRVFAPIGEYWFGYPSDRASNLHRTDSDALGTEQRVGASANLDELLKDAEDVKLSVMIVMPSFDNRVYRGTERRSRDKGKRVSRSSSQLHSGHHTEETVGDQDYDIVETTTANQGIRHDQEAEELPELVLGMAVVALRTPTPTPLPGKEMEASASRTSTTVPSSAPTAPP